MSSVDQIDRMSLIGGRAVTYLGVIGIWVYLWLGPFKAAVDQIFGQQPEWLLVMMIIISLCHGVAVQHTFDRSATGVMLVWVSESKIMALVAFAWVGIVFETTTLAQVVPMWAFAVVHLSFGQLMGSSMILSWQKIKQLS